MPTLPTMPTVAVVNRKGGASKTTTAVTLAELATRTGTHSTVVDVDPMAGATIWRDLAAAEGEPMAATILQPPADVSAVQFPRWARSNLTGLVFVDVNPGHVDWHEAAVEAAADTAGAVLVPCSQSAADVAQTVITLQTLEHAPVPVYVVLTATHTGTVRQREARKELAEDGATVLEAEVPHRQEIAQQTGVEPFRADSLLLNLYYPVLVELKGLVGW